MSLTNNDFRSADEVVTPDNLAEMCGWAPEDSDGKTATDKEKRLFEVFEQDSPEVFQMKAQDDIPEEILKAWNDFQKEKGRYPGSFDWSLLDEFVVGEPLIWLPQKIGSCVISNTFRIYVIRMMYQVVLRGRAQEYFGRNEFGQNNWAPYAPFSYGMARERANLRGGDGLYCAPMLQSLAEDGVLQCSTPALRSILEPRGSVDDRDYPETQDNQLYRDFGDWKFNDKLKAYADNKVNETSMVKSADDLWRKLEQGKPSFVCSMEAIHKVGLHRDGFPVHARNPRDQWAHNMAFVGGFIASDGERFFRESNESWGKDAIYNRRFEEVEQAFQRGDLTVGNIGNIDAPMSGPPTI